MLGLILLISLVGCGERNKAEVYFLNFKPESAEIYQEIAKKYEFKPIIWADMYFGPWNNGEYVFIDGKKEVPQYVKDSVHPDVIPVYWDYYRDNEEAYDNMLYNHEQLSNKTWFAGGVWSWRGFIPHNRYSLETMLPALDACTDYKPFVRRMIEMSLDKLASL